MGNERSVQTAGGNCQESTRRRLPGLFKYESNKQTSDTTVRYSFQWRHWVHIWVPLIWAVVGQVSGHNWAGIIAGHLLCHTLVPRTVAEFSGETPKINCFPQTVLSDSKLFYSPWNTAIIGGLEHVFRSNKAMQYLWRPFAREQLWLRVTVFKPRLQGSWRLVTDQYGKQNDGLNGFLVWWVRALMANMGSLLPVFLLDTLEHLWIRLIKSVNRSAI